MDDEPGDTTTESPDRLPANSVEVDDVNWSSWISDHADRLRAFDLDLFVDDEPTARLAAGALIFASTVTVDQLFTDLEPLNEAGGTVGDGGAYLIG